MRDLSPEPWRVKVVERIPEGKEPRTRHPFKGNTNSHLKYVAQVVKRLHREPEKLPGVRIVRQAPVLRHFTAEFELV